METAGAGRNGTTVPVLVCLAPTLFELCGLNPPASSLGESLIPLMRGEACEPLVAFSQGTLYGSDKLSWRTADGLHLVYDRAAGAPVPVELYDRTEDPLELHDLALDRPELAEAKRRELARFYNDLQERAKSIRTPDRLDMGPTRIRRFLESLEALGYVEPSDER